MTRQSPTLARVVEGRLCSGCGLCAGVSDGAVAMAARAPGFARPVQSRPLPQAVEAQIALACPGAKVAAWSPGPNRHPYWGPAITVATGFSTDEEIRYAGASGGALSALLVHALESGLVDRVLHIEADPDNPIGNRLCWSRTRAEVIAAAGSRYAPSSPLMEIDAALADGGRFAFVGKPCDVSALRQLATVDPRVDAHVPIMLSFYCGGLPSSDGARRIIRDMGLEPEAVEEFRYRGNGWPGLTAARTRTGEIGEMPYSRSWGEHLSREVQFRCKICPDAVGGVADIACADAWYGDDSGYPKFEEQDGRSLIQARTPAGQALLDAAVAAAAMVAEPLEVGEIDRMQPFQANRKRLVSARSAACRVLFRPVPVMNGLDVARAARHASLGDKARNFVGTLKRVMSGRY